MREMPHRWAALLLPLALLAGWPQGAQAARSRLYWDVARSRVAGQVRGVLFGDFDGDGRDDLAVTHIVVDEGSGRILRWMSVFLQSPRGFPERAGQAWLLDETAVVITAADVIAGNRGPELVYATAQGVRCYVYGERGFEVVPRTLLSAPSVFSAPDPGIVPTFAFARDLTGDGVPEIVLPNPGGRGLRIFGQDGQGTYRLAQKLSLDLVAEWGHHWENNPILNRLYQMDLRESLFFPTLTLADFNADGRADLFFAATNRLQVFLRKPGTPVRFEETPQTFIFSALKTEEFLRFFQMRKIIRLWVEDFNKDGRADVYLTQASIRKLGIGGAYTRAHVYYNRGGEFSRVPDQEFEVDGLAETAWSGDLTGDGYPDLVFQYFPFSLTSIVRIMLLGSIGIHYALYRFDPALGRFGEKPFEERSVGFDFEAKANSAIWAAYLFWQDFDGDGRADLLQATGPDEISYFLSEGDEWAAREESLRVPTSFFVYGRDLNGDGRDDLLFRYENIAERNSELWLVRSRPAPPQAP